MDGVVRFLALAVLLVSASGCGQKRVFAPTPEGEYEQANEFYQKEDYSKAIEALKQVIYKYPGSDLVEHARYYLADSYFLNEDYVLAADEFERLNREFPQGRFSDVALFKAALCYEKQSRRLERDQSETLKAIETIENLLSKYPNTEYADTAREHSRILKDRLAQKEYRTAMFYFDMKLYDSSIIYLKSMLENYPESSVTPGALYHLYVSSRRMGYPDDAKDARDRLCSEFPDNEFSHLTCGASEEPMSGGAVSGSGMPSDSTAAPAKP
jgi:outer membrane protein assembly factor BamD